MSNTSIIGAALVIGFFVYITVKGELSAYLGVLGIGSGAGSCAASTPAAAPVNPLTSSTTTNILTPFGLGM